MKLYLYADDGKLKQAWDIESPVIVDLICTDDGCGLWFKTRKTEEICEIEKVDKLLEQAISETINRVVFDLIRRGILTPSGLYGKRPL